MRWLAAVLVFCLAALGHSISYTVQVAAVSDQESALSLVRNLLRDGYPAYFVRTTTDAGFVFRIRVGAFQNRGAALLYAEAMPAVAGARPIPALAEAIPTGIMPLAPSLLLTADVDGLEAELLPWNDGVALRTQQIEPLQEAAYYLLETSDPIPFRAWSAAPDGDQAVRVRNLGLWPDAAEDGEDAPEVRAEFASQLRGLIAVQLGLEAAVVDDATMTDDGGMPVLVVVERFRPGDPDSGELIGLADPNGRVGPYGPTEFVAGADAAPPRPEPLVRLDEERRAAGAEPAEEQVGEHQAGEQEAGEQEAGEQAVGEQEPGEQQAGEQPDAEEPGAEETVAGDGWSAAGDGAFARLAVDETSWRAAVGTPLWAVGDLLITRHQGVLHFYRFERRSLTEQE